jgi:aryl-alcohol dehydrogenase-like predicted oxidoreductase
MATSIPNESTGHEQDLVTLFSSMNHDAEMEALALQSLLEANGIESAVVGPSTIPSVEFQVQVPRAQLADAEKVMQEAREAGPSAAEEAEAAEEAAEASGTTPE